MKQVYVSLISMLITFVWFNLDLTTGEAQVIHKNDIQNFIGSITTTPLSARSTGKRGIVKSEEITGYKVNLDREEFNELLYTRKTVSDTLVQQTVAYLRDRGPVFHLNIKEKGRWLVLLNNGEYETSSTYLTVWSQKGDSLHFDHIHKKPFRVGLGFVKFEDHYQLTDQRSVVFVLNSEGGDAGYVHGAYSFYHMDDNYELIRLVKKEYGTGEEPQTKSIVLYSFLDRRTLFTNTVTLSFSRCRDTTGGGSYGTYVDWEIVSAKPELFELQPLINQKISTKDQ